MSNLDLLVKELCYLAKADRGIEQLVGKPVRVTDGGAVPIVASTIASLRPDFIPQKQQVNGICFEMYGGFRLVIKPSELTHASWILSGQFTIGILVSGPREHHSVYINEELIFNELGLRKRR